MKAAGLREMRQQKGWTQQRTAEALGVTQAYLSMLEQGSVRFRVSSHIGLSQHFTYLPRSCRCRLKQMT